MTYYLNFGDGGILGEDREGAEEVCEGAIDLDLVGVAAGVLVAAIAFHLSALVSKGQGPLYAVDDIGIVVFGQPSPHANAVDFVPELLPLFLGWSN